MLNIRSVGAGVTEESVRCSHRSDNLRVGKRASNFVRQRHLGEHARDMNASRTCRRPLRRTGKCVTCGKRHRISEGLSKVENDEGPYFGNGDPSATQELDDEFMMLACSHFIVGCSLRIKNPGTRNHSHSSFSESERRRSVSVCDICVKGKQSTRRACLRNIRKSRL